jgi:hypothetical protein
MNETFDKKNILNTWKEIANYLDVEVKTAQRWEKELCMPVHRSKISPKSRVFAYKDELDAWNPKNRRSGTILKSESVPRQEELLPKPSGKSGNYWKLLLIITPIPAILIILFLIFNPSGQPVDFKIVDSQLIILDENQQELWRHDTEFENLLTEKKFKDHFQSKKRIDSDVLFPYIIIRDFDTDGNNEVLFNPRTQNDNGGGSLYFFDHRGKQLWKFQSGMELKFGSIVYSRDYRILGMDVCDLDNKGDPEIIVIAAQKPFFPSQMVVLDLKGNVLGEYWNSGYFTDFICIDLNLNGRKEIIACGVNNEYKKGFLAIFDSNDISGCSPQQQDYYKCSSLKPGSEKYYTIVPRTALDLMKNEIECCTSVTILTNGHISTATQQSNLYFEFNKNMELLHINSSHKFEFMYRQAIKEGKITGELNDRYFQQLKTDTLYYNGREWTSRPSMSNPW